MSIKDNRTLFIVLQIIGGLIIVGILYIVTLLILNTDALVLYIDNKVKQNEMISIIDGKSGVLKLSGRQFNTVNAYSTNFKKIGKSLNNKGGAQFTYQFWMKIKDTDNANYNNLTVFLRGDKNKYTKGLYDIDTNKIIPNVGSAPNPTGDYMVKCPLLKFGQSYTNMILELNTNKDPSTRIEIKLDGSDQLNKKNLLSLAPLSWYLITIVLEDNFSYSTTSENGIKVSFYINDYEYKISSASTDALLKNNFIKQNEGDLYLFPDISQTKDFMQIANFKYYNYALAYADVSSMFLKGPPSYEMKDESEGDSNKPAFISAYNKLDIYNY
jgi:hypothetical protein